MPGTPKSFSSLNSSILYKCTGKSSIDLYPDNPLYRPRYQILVPLGIAISKLCFLTNRPLLLYCVVDYPS